MTSPSEPRGSEPVDPDFASLFRPDDDPAPQVAQQPMFSDVPAFDEVVATSEAEDAPAEPVTDEPADAEPPADDFEAAAVDGVAANSAPGPVDPVADPVDPVVDTGRLFRSQGVVDRSDAVLALASDHGGRLRTLTRTDKVGMQPPEPGPSTSADPMVIPASAAAIVIDDEGAAPARRGRRGNHSERPDREVRVHRRGRRDITAGAVYILVIGVTVAVAFADALLHNGDLGWLTGIALAIVSIYCALTVTRDDDIVAIYTPPIAFLVATLTAGQLFLGSADKSLINRGVVVFFDLADNWYWIIGTTLVVVIIVAVRRRRA